MTTLAARDERRDPAPAGTARLIRRHAAPAVTSWQPVSLGDKQRAAPSSQEMDAAIAAARQRGYEDGYRDGLAALAAFKESCTRDAQAKVGERLIAFDAELLALEGELAQGLVRTALQLARQVVRAELRSEPAHVVSLAKEAIDALLASARQVVIRVHPDDAALIEQGAGDAIRARGARLVADAAIERGGVIVDADIGSVDATLDTRWREATAALV